MVMGKRAGRAAGTSKPRRRRGVMILVASSVDDQAIQPVDREIWSADAASSKRISPRSIGARTRPALQVVHRPAQE
jgi:hypothetical protein